VNCSRREGREGSPGGIPTRTELHRSRRDSLGQVRSPASIRTAPPLDDLERLLNETDDENGYPLLVRLALAHYQFETIHPFRDGNGRVGRLLIPLGLQAAERLNSPTLYLSSFFERNQQAYADLMLAVSQRGQYENWIQFFLAAVRSSAQESVQQANRLTTLRDSYHAKFHERRKSALLHKLIDSLFELPLITIAKVGEVLKVTPATAAKYVESLERAGIVVEITQRARDRQYVAQELLDIIESDDTLAS
jgi:Fic family protein